MLMIIATSIVIIIIATKNNNTDRNARHFEIEATLEIVESKMKSDQRLIMTSIINAMISAIPPTSKKKVFGEAKLQIT